MRPPHVLCQLHPVGGGAGAAEANLFVKLPKELLDYNAITLSSSHAAHDANVHDGARE